MTKQELANTLNPSGEVYPESVLDEIYDAAIDECIKMMKEQHLEELDAVEDLKKQRWA